MRKLKAPGKLRIVASAGVALVVAVSTVGLVLANIDGAPSVSVQSPDPVLQGNSASYTMSFATKNNNGFGNQKCYQISQIANADGATGLGFTTDELTNVGNGSQSLGFHLTTPSGLAGGTYHPTVTLQEYSWSWSLSEGWHCGGTTSVHPNVSVTLNVSAGTLYVVPNNQSITYGTSAPGSSFYTFSLRLNSAGGTVVNPATLSNYVAPTCTSAYTASTHASPPTLTISCSGGSATGYAFNRTSTAQLTIKSAQTITFTSTAPTRATVNGATYAVSATASSGLTPVTFSASPADVCSVSGNVVSFGLNTGTCTITADQAGNASYGSATATQSFTVKRANGVHMSLPAAPVVGGSYTPTKSSDAGTPVTLTVDPTSSSVCTINASDLVSFIGVGTCDITGTAPGDATHWADSTQFGFTVGKGSQTIAWDTTAPASKTIGDPTYTPAAHATSGLAVTLSIDPTSAAVCSINGSNVVTWIGAGTCRINANQAGNSNWNAAPQVYQQITVNKKTQTIDFTNPGTKRLDESPFTLGATASSGLAIKYSVTAGTCTLSGSSVTLHSVGDCTIEATQAGDATWDVATPVSQTFTVTKGNQTVNLPNPGTKSFGDAPFALGATASSGLPVDYEVTAGTCTVAAGILTIHGVGDCTIVASQAGDANWNPASTGGTLIVVKGDQTIDFTNPGPKTFTTPPFDLGATASSGLPVSYAVTAGTCTLAGSTLTIHGTGDCTVEASQAGDTNWNAATPVSRTFTVGVGDQTIDFPAIADKPFGTAPFHLGATATSGLPVVYAVSAGTCTVSGDLLTIHGLGDCTVDAGQIGDANWNIAPVVSHTFAVVAGTQTITFPAIPTVSLTSGSVTLAATASSGLPITYAVTAGTCTVAGNVLTAHTVGDCTVQASQAGSEEWLGAEAVSRTVTVSAKLVLTITAVNQARPQGAANPTFTYAVAGYAAGDDDTAITTKPTCTTLATADSPVGTYPISCSGGVSAKYDFSYVAGTLTIANEQVAGATGTPQRQVTPPPTSTSGSQNSSSTTLPVVLLISLAFGGLGLLMVIGQRRSIRQ